MRRETLRQRDERGVAQVAQVDFRLLGEGRIGRCSEKDVIGEQRQLRTVLVIADTLVQRHQDGIQLHVFQLVEQVDIGAEDEVDVEFAAAQLQAHDQLRDGFNRQRIERPELEPLGREPRRLAGLAHGFEHVLHQLLRLFLQHICAFQRNQIASLVLEQWAAQRTFERMDCAVHADIAGVQLGGRLAQIAAAHEGQKHLQLFQREFFIDLHGACSRAGGQLCPKAGLCVHRWRTLTARCSDMISAPFCDLQHRSVNLHIARVQLADRASCNS